jgi:hypothetical protein
LLTIASNFRHYFHRKPACRWVPALSPLFPSLPLSSAHSLTSTKIFFSPDLPRRNIARAPDVLTALRSTLCFSSGQNRCCRSNFRDRRRRPHLISYSLAIVVRRNCIAVVLQCRRRRISPRRWAPPSSTPSSLWILIARPRLEGSTESVPAYWVRPRHLPLVSPNQMSQTHLNSNFQIPDSVQIL